MSVEVKSLPNDKIAIVCKINNNENNTYTLIPTSVTIGQIDENLIFHSENGEYQIPPVDRVEHLKNPDNTYFYVYCDTVDNLCQEYDETDVTKVMFEYFMDIASQLNIALVDGDLVKVYHQDYSAISEEIKGQISKRYEEVPEAEKKPQIYVNKNNLLPTNVDLDNIDKNALASYVKSHIFENDSVIDDIVTTIAMNYSAKRKEEIKSMLSIGNTGCGKTATYELISEYLGVPFTMFDCTNMSASGYQGDSMSDLIRAIYRNAKDKPQLIGKSIVVLEEFDKIAARGFGVTDINVQYELLKFLDGFTYHINSDKVLNAGNEISVDTTFMTKAGLGAFEELFEKKLREARGMGFAAWNSGPIEITDKDINDFGMTKQIIRRFLFTFLYKDLNFDDLRRILTTSKGSPLVISKERYLRDFNTILEYTAEYVDAIVEYSLKIKSGAGGLKKAVSKSLIKADSAVYDRALTGDKSQKRLLVTAETVADPCKFTY